MRVSTLHTASSLSAPWCYVMCMFMTSSQIYTHILGVWYLSHKPGVRHDNIRAKPTDDTRMNTSCNTAPAHLFSFVFARIVSLMSARCCSWSSLACASPISATYCCLIASSCVIYIYIYIYNVYMYVCVLRHVHICICVHACCLRVGASFGVFYFAHVHTHMLYPHSYEAFQEMSVYT